MLNKDGILLQVLNEGSYFPNFDSVVFKDIPLKRGGVIASSTEVRCDFNTDNPHSLRVMYDSNSVIIPIELAYRYIQGFTKPPKMRQMSDWMNDGGYCLTVIGNKVHPNGYGPHGDPSWMIVLRSGKVSA